MTPQDTVLPKAVTVYQELLDSLSDAILARDLETVRARTHLPFVHRTLDAEIVVETEADLDSGIQGMAQALLARGVNQLIRLSLHPTDDDFNNQTTQTLEPVSYYCSS